MLKHLTDLAMDMKINKQYQKLARKCAEEIYTAMKITHTDRINLTELSSTICVGEPKDYMAVIEASLDDTKSQVNLIGIRTYGVLTQREIMPLAYFAEMGANLSALHEEVMYETRHKSAWVEFMAKPQPFQQKYIENNILISNFFFPDDYGKWDSYIAIYGSESVVKSLINGNVSENDAYVCFDNIYKNAFIGFGSWQDVLDYFRERIVRLMLNQTK